MDDFAGCTLLWPCALMIQNERLETSFSPKNYGQRSPCACGHDGPFFASSSFYLSHVMQCLHQSRNGLPCFAG